jgi:hypothetical protein
MGGSGKMELSGKFSYLETDWQTLLKQETI